MIKGSTGKPCKFTIGIGWIDLRFEKFTMGMGWFTMRKEWEFVLSGNNANWIKGISTIQTQQWNSRSSRNALPLPFFCSNLLQKVSQNTIFIIQKSRSILSLTVRPIHWPNIIPLGTKWSLIWRASFVWLRIIRHLGRTGKQNNARIIRDGGAISNPNGRPRHTQTHIIRLSRQLSSFQSCELCVSLCVCVSCSQCSSSAAAPFHRLALRSCCRLAVPLVCHFKTNLGCCVPRESEWKDPSSPVLAAHLSPSKWTVFFF